ncbi:MAG TPA: fasciclin domain-containing protein [Sphingomicrobium sp.]|nr:fasciclin domain-containing protein [Sphingomicrobium sp.]
MIKPWIFGCVAALALTACGKQGEPTATTDTAAEKAGDKTLATGLGDNAKLAAAVKAAGLEATLAGPGPYTLLAPGDAAFSNLPAGTLDTLMKPESRAELTALLTHHILPGTVLAADIGKAIDAGKGKAMIATIGGGTLTATREGDKIVLADAKGTKAVVVTADQNRSNGVLHQVDSVLMPTE